VIYFYNLIHLKNKTDIFYPFYDLKMDEAQKKPLGEPNTSYGTHSKLKKFFIMIIAGLYLFIYLLFDRRI
jgi:hypothetical protein